MSITVLVVDDEALPRQRIRDLVAATPAFTLIGEAADGATALDLIVEHRPDLVFLDIQMPELDGLEVVASLPAEVAPAIIFVTAYDEYAIRAFEIDAIDYLLKPVTPDRFAAAAARACARIGRSQDPAAAALRALASKLTEQRGWATRFVSRRSAKHYFVPVSDIEWIEAVGNYARLHTAGGVHLIRETMKELESRLDPDRFVRVHRSAIVAIERIRSIETREHGEYRITTASGATLVSSRGYSGRVRALIR